MKDRSYRIYGQTLNVWAHTDETGRQHIVQREVAYKEYDSSTHELIAEGSEDFSPERYRSTVTEKLVWTWDGSQVNRGGHRKFDFRGYVNYPTSAAAIVKDRYMKRYKAAAVQFR